jgi:hypothetical protein
VVVDLEETEDRNDCAGEDQQQFNRPKLVMTMTAVNDRPVLSSERAPHIEKTATVRQ